MNASGLDVDGIPMNVNDPDVDETPVNVNDLVVSGNQTNWTQSGRDPPS